MTLNLHHVEEPGRETAKHTPGPWAVDPDDRKGMEWNNHIVVADNPHLRICFMAHSGKPDNSEWEANARLIAAAPTLIEALREVRRDIIESTDDVVWMRGGRETVVERIDAALKAAGCE